jgi:UDP-glucose/GDP-mannose dehydrogenase family, NAD binding domain/Glycosyl transferase family 2
MPVTVLGVGYLGLTHALRMRDLGHEVLAIDADQGKIARAAGGESPFSCFGFDLLRRKNLNAGTLHFASSYAQAANFADVHFLCIDAPDGDDSIADLESVYGAADAFAPHLKARCLIVGNSRVTVDTARRIMDRIKSVAPAGREVDVVWNPDFLHEDVARKCRVGVERLLGTSPWAEAQLRQLRHSRLEVGNAALIRDFEAAAMVEASTGGNSGLEADGRSFVNKRFMVQSIASNSSIGNVTASLDVDVRECVTEERLSVPVHDPVAVATVAQIDSGFRHKQGTELTVVMPCLNEAETVMICVRKAVAFLAEHRIDGEVVVADNGSTDGSQQLAREAGARVVAVAERGYGNALLGGIMAARGRYVIMGDADDSYDFTALMPFIDRLRAGADLVVGNRFEGGIAPGAMPALHRYLGNPILSFTGRLFFRSKIGDFHCGLRGFRRDSVLRLGLQASGMEFASEMVVKATLAGQCVEEVPTTLSPDGRSRPPHLRSWRDGWRHLRFLLLFSPRWLFLIPGTVLFAVGLAISIVACSAPLTLGTMSLNVNALAFASALVVIGFQSVLFGFFTQIYASEEGFLPQGAMVNRLLMVLNLERALLAGGVLALTGAVGLAASFAQWQGPELGHISYTNTLCIAVPSATALTLSCQLILGAFFLSILGIRRTRRPVLLDRIRDVDVLAEPEATGELADA